MNHADILGYIFKNEFIIEMRFILKVIILSILRNICVRRTIFLFKNI